MTRVFLGLCQMEGGAGPLSSLLFSPQKLCVCKITVHSPLAPSSATAEQNKNKTKLLKQMQSLPCPEHLNSQRRQRETQFLTSEMSWLFLLMSFMVFVKVHSLFWNVLGVISWTPAQASCSSAHDSPSPPPPSSYNTGIEPSECQHLPRTFLLCFWRPLLTKNKTPTRAKIRTRKKSFSSTHGLAAVTCKWKVQCGEKSNKYA